MFTTVGVGMDIGTSMRLNRRWVIMTDSDLIFRGPLGCQHLNAGLQMLPSIGSMLCRSSAHIAVAMYMIVAQFRRFQDAL